VRRPRLTGEKAERSFSLRSLRALRLIVGTFLCGVLWASPAFAQQTHLLVITGVPGTETVAEFAFGTSDFAPVGDPSEKGRKGTVHFALGDNQNCYPGGQNRSVLHLDGVLAFDEVVAERIEREELLSSGSEEEVEMRACALQAVELIKAETGRTAMELDHLLWNRGQGAEYKARPRPRCRSVFY